ncbi:MAG: PKD domain-containing protein, partial [Planctomycetota bacterium]|nr:PKD domain-containing protein [Planctomycetota bacterium]
LADVGQRDPDDPPRASAVALDDNGCGLAVISGRASTQAYELDETGEWGEGDTLATTSAMGFALDVIESKQAAVVWTDEGGAVRASLYDSLGGFGEPVELQNSDATAPSVSLRPDGRAIAVYGVVGADDVAVTANQFIPDLGWSDPRAVGVVASEPVSTDVDSDEDGTSVAVFGNDEESGDYEWRPPTAVIGLPEADPVAGTNANYSGTGSFAHGEGNAIVSYAWDFDADGTRESNDPVAAHAFPNAGLRRVQLEVVDAWGMTGRAVREVEVEEADSGGGFFLTIRVEGEGTVHLAPLDQQCSDTCRIEVPPGTVVDLFPLPDDGSHLGRLTGCDQPDDIDQGLEGCRFTMNGDRTFTVRFEPD